MTGVYWLNVFVVNMGYGYGAIPPPEAQPVVKPAGSDAAYETAIRLLLSVLSPEQRESWERTGKFFVTGKSGARYELECERAGFLRTHRHDDDGRIEYWCVYPDPYPKGMTDYMIPWPDLAAGLVMHLRHDDLAVSKIAIKSRVR